MTDTETDTENPGWCQLILDHVVKLRSRERERYAIPEAATKNMEF